MFLLTLYSGNLSSHFLCGDEEEKEEEEESGTDACRWGVANMLLVFFPPSPPRSLMQGCGARRLIPFMLMF